MIDAGAGLAAHVDALPEALRGEQDGVDVGAEGLEQALARRLALHEQRVGAEPCGHQAAHGLERAPAREQAQRAPLAGAHDRDDVVGDRLIPARGARVGRVARQVQQRLGLDVERRGQHELARAREPQARAREREIAVERERGRGEHGGVQPPPEVLAQQRRDRDRRRAQLRPGAAALAPDDGLLVIGAETGVERDAQALRAPRDDVALLPHAAEPRRQAAERVAHARGLAGGEVAQLAPRAGACARAQRAAGRRGACAALSSSCSSRAGELALSRRQARSQSRRSCVDVAQREAGAQPLRRRVLELVRLVEDDGVVLRQHADRAVRGDAQPEIGEVERMVDDHDVGVGGPLARLLGEARGRERAARAEAALGADGHLRPRARGRLVVELGAVTR